MCDTILSNHENKSILDGETFGSCLREIRIAGVIADGVQMVLKVN